MKARRTILAVVFAVLMSASVYAPAETALCERCGGTGRVVNRKTRYFAKMYDAGLVPLADSEYAKYPDCYGTGYRPCPVCGGKKWKEELAKRKERCEALIKERAAVMKKIFPDGKLPRRKIYHARSKHFTITYNCKARAGKRFKFDDHTVGWLMLAQLEDAYKLFMKFVGAEKDEELKFWDDQPRCFYLWFDQATQLKCSQALAGMANPVSTVYKPFFCSMVENEFSEHTDHYLVHHAFQLLVDGLEPWRDRAIPEWFINGVGNWAEYELFQECNIAAIGEGMTPWDISIPFLGWPQIIRKMIKEKKIQPLASYAKCNIRELTADLRVQSYGIIDYLYRVYGGKKMRQFIVRMKETKDQFRALRDVYGLSPGELDEKWQAWALKEYKHRK